MPRSVEAGLQTRLPRADDIHVGGIVLAFTAALSLLSGIAFGMAPAWQIVQPRLVDALRRSGTTSSSGRPGTRRMSALVVAQVALSIVLLVGAALILRSLGRLSAVETGFRPEGLLTMRVPLATTRYDTPGKRAAFFEALVRHVEALPRVRGVAVTRALPTTNTLGTNIGVACLFVAATLLAGLLPALRAARLDPAAVLRSE